MSFNGRPEINAMIVLQPPKRESYSILRYTRNTDTYYRRTRIPLVHPVLVPICSRRIHLDRSRRKKHAFIILMNKHIITTFFMTKYIIDA